MRWYEYKMETDDLCAPEDLKAKLLAMTDQLTEEEKNQPMMKTPAPARPAVAPSGPAAGKVLPPRRRARCGFRSPKIFLGAKFFEGLPRFDTRKRGYGSKNCKSGANMAVTSPGWWTLTICK